MSELIHTRGIVFHRIKYSDSSLIIKVYTEKLGLRSYLVKGVRGKKASIALYSPLNLLEMVVYERDNKDLQYVKEVRMERTYQHIPFSEKRQAIALFINEILYRSIREEEENPILFSFIYEHLLLLDEAQHPGPDFHLYFLIHLSRMLGFGPEDNYAGDRNCFSLKDGSFCSSQSLDDSLLDPVQSRALVSLMRMQDNTALSNPSRRQILAALTKYYRIHLEGMGELRSQEVLERVFA